MSGVSPQPGTAGHTNTTGGTGVSPTQSTST